MRVRRGIKFLVGGLLGGTLLVAILSAAFHDWSYLGRWASGLAGIGLAIVVTLAKYWLMRLALALSSVATRTGARAGCLTKALADPVPTSPRCIRLALQNGYPVLPA